MFPNTRGPRNTSDYSKMNTDWKFVKKSNAPDVINQLNLFKIDAYKNNLSQTIFLLFS